ncbi:MAG: hypothetical protein CMK32_09915 [Porticoccaceae bacterium]|nr:hypothetical protein [Porticoccaceae bacterium]
MSVSTIATGDTVQIYAEASDDWTDNQRVTLQTADVDCKVQMLSADESDGFLSDAEAKGVQVLFASDPSLNSRCYLKHTARADGSISARWFKVMGTFEEGRPGQTLLWVAMCEELTGAGAPTVV